MWQKGRFTIQTSALVSSGAAELNTILIGAVVIAESINGIRDYHDYHVKGN